MFSIGTRLAEQQATVSAHNGPSLYWSGKSRRIELWKRGKGLSESINLNLQWWRH
jgi:hypothetical protein